MFKFFGEIDLDFADSLIFGYGNLDDNGEINFFNFGDYGDFGGDLDLFNISRFPSL